MLPAPSPASVVLVTGASQGIGEQLARTLHARGHALVLNARGEDKLEQLADELRAGPAAAPVELLPGDVGDDAHRARLVDALAGRRLVGVCNNAGFGKVGRLLDQDPDTLDQCVRVNVLALHDLTVRLLPAMVERGTGAILNIASTASFQPVPGLATYAATKAFVQSFTEGLHGELRGTGVSVGSVCPGPTHTEFAVRAGVDGEVRKVPDALLDDPRHVAELAVRLMESGGRTVVPRPMNRLQVLGARVVPHRVLVPLLGRIARRA